MNKKNKLTKIDITKKLASCTPNQNITKNIEDLTQFELYRALKSIIFNIIDSDTLKQWSEQLDEITYFMLETRFKQLPTSIGKKKTRIRDEEGRIISSRKPLDTDLMRYLGIKQKVKHIPANPLHIIKFYKLLENIVLTGKINEDIEKWNLGHFETTCKALVNSLSTLLLSIEKLTGSQKKWQLTYLFSSIIIYRQFKVKTTPDTSTISTPYNGADKTKVIDLFSDKSMTEWIETTFSNNLLEKDIVIKFYSGNASSPNSLSSTSKLLEDAWAVKNDNKLREAILNLSDHFEGGKDFRHFVETLFENIWDMEPTIHSRLFHFTAPGGKARIIANVDFISQSVLSGLHYYFFSLLKSLKSDMTFNHKGGIDYIYKDKSSFYSIDLSAATDRVPRFLEQKLIKNLMNKKGLDGGKISEYWESIMDREFHTDPGLNNGKPIRYETGQNMGMFTSWSSMALLHHYIVNKLCNINTNDYVLVGDDLVIRDNKEGYLKYLHIMNLIGVSVNKTKTLESESEQINIEFARNYIIRGMKIIPLQFGLLFAWSDERTSLESVMFNSDWIQQEDCFVHFLNKFKKFFSTKRSIYLLFAKYKFNYNFINEKKIKEIFALPKWVDRIDFNKIKEISHNENENLATLIIDDKSSIATLKSKLVVRTTKDIDRVVDLAKRFIMLKFVDDDIAKIAIAYHDRMNNVSLIQYDVECLGNPYFTKKRAKIDRYGHILLI